MKEQKPPNLSRRTAKEIDKEVDRLKARPGEWYLMMKSVSSGTQRVYTKRGCQVRMKREKTGVERFSIWARWPKEK